jgi:hypothetical protein
LADAAADPLVVLAAAPEVEAAPEAAGLAEAEALMATDAAALPEVDEAVPVPPHAASMASPAIVLIQRRG